MTEMEKNMNEILRTIKRMEHDKVGTYAAGTVNGYLSAIGDSMGTLNGM